MKGKTRHYVSAQGTSVDPDYLATETTNKQDEQNDLKTKIAKKEDIKTERTKQEDIMTERTNKGDKKTKLTKKEDQMTVRAKKDSLMTETTEKEEPKPESTQIRDGSSYEFVKSLWESEDLTLDPGGKAAYYWMVTGLIIKTYGEMLECGSCAYSLV